jgi:hypothetical protein
MSPPSFPAQPPLFRQTIITCCKCHELVRPLFTHVAGPNSDRWEGRCTYCGAVNVLHSPSWRPKELPGKAAKS